ncbi:MAG: GNAT family N-acetyltransferase [Alphaproteobacteria bacterium]|nr:GNAT family N-acetyltransferase [Alphaproteobacteria bacterium]
MLNFSIREFCAYDIEDLLILMCELAEFEGYLNDFAIDANYLLQHGLEKEEPDFGILVAAVESKLVGYLAYYTVPFTYYGHPNLVLKELYISPDFRNQGIGRALMSKLIEFARRHDAKNIQWLVLKDNPSARLFYENIGGIEDKKWDRWELALS